MTPSQPLRILHLTGASEAGGLSRYILDLCQGMRQRGHQVAVAGARGAWHERFAAAEIPWIELPLNGGYFALRQATGQLRRYLESHPVDVLHTHYRKASLVARSVARGGHQPILYTVHLSGIPLGGPWRWLTDFGDKTHAPSQGARRWLLEEAHIPENRIALIPHGIDVARFPRRDAAVKASARTALGIPTETTVALFAGRLDSPKNADWMLDVAQANPTAMILMAGDGPDRASLERSIAQRNLSGHIRMLGDCDVLPAYQAADALLLPSTREGFGLVCAEAMSVGVPVLRTQTSGTEELIVPGVTGQSTPINRDLFVRASTGFLSDRAKLEQMGKAASQRIAEHFTLPRQIDETIALYIQMTAPKSGG